LFACAAYVEGQRPSGCSPKTMTKWMLDNDQVDASIALPKFARGSMRVQDYDGLSGELSRSIAPFRETQDHMVDARLDYRDAGAMEKLNEVNDKVYKALQEVRCAEDACLEHQVSTQERRGRRGCRGQRSSSAHPRQPHHGRR
jgi:hypothetical protein